MRIPVFILVFLLLYGTVQFYIFWTVHRAFPHAGWARIPFVAFLVLMSLSPMLMHRLERSGMSVAAEALAYVGYCWMAVAFWFTRAS